MARKFFLVAAGMFLLALSYHFGASMATAQSAGNPAVALANEGTGGYMLALTANGDLYRAQGFTRTYSFELVGNIFSGAPTPALHESWGQLKSRYHTTPSATPGMTATPGANDR
jgi:hypothetical protein